MRQFHNMSLYYCIDGKGWFRRDGQKFSVKANRYFILPAGRPHSYGADANDPWTIYWIHFKGSLASNLVGRCSRPIEINPGVYSRISDRIGMFEEIFHTLELGYSHENLLYACSIFYHFLGTLRYLQQYRDAARSDTGDNDIVTTAIHFMKENIEKKLTLNEVATHVGFSVSYFTVLFNQRTGCAPMAYFNQLKMQLACQLLDFTDMKVNQICYKVGIEDTYYFSRLFSKIMGMSPIEYRKLKKG